MITEGIKAEAKEFAINALQGQIDALSDAYLKGYESAISKILPKHIIDGGDFFVDVMLDSGTMWSTDVRHTPGDYRFYEQLGYTKALEYGIPTQEQYEELFASCRRQFDKYIGKNTNSVIVLNAKGAPTYTWVKSDVINDEALAYEWTYMAYPKLVRRYIGFTACFHRVKIKNEQ